MTAMTTEKTTRTNFLLLEQNAREAMEAHNVQQNGVSRLTIAQLKPLLLWKLQGKPVKGTKAQQIEQWNQLPEPAAAIPWTEDDESTLQSLKTKEISLNDTALAGERKRMVTAVAAQIKHCSPATIQTLEEKIREEIINKINAPNQN
ncbi:MAG: hypothetical protein EAZ17_03925 [Sphingobacteriales bacterium]|nr:MAG: hypothetical protein EAZ17_03925 [Sphingobacteriales bacterium]